MYSTVKVGGKTREKPEKNYVIAKLLQYFKQEFFYRIKCKKNKPKKQHIIISLKRKQKNGC
jgi:hypothetical protein